MTSKQIDGLGQALNLSSTGLLVATGTKTVVTGFLFLGTAGRKGGGGGRGEGEGKLARTCTLK